MDKIDEIRTREDLIESVDFGDEKFYFEWKGITFISTRKILSIDSETFEPIYE